MATYIINTYVTTEWSYTIDAESKAEARDIFNAGDINPGEPGDVVDEEIVSINTYRYKESI